MIEFALLFALGFLTAAILGLMAAPMVQRRIVRFAEERLKATMPLSPQEVRAQKDSARASYAAENARTSQMLKRESEKNVTLMLRNGTILKDAQRIVGENADLHAQLADMNVEAADLRSSIRQLEQNIERLKATLVDVERDNVRKTIDIKTLTRQLDHVSTDVDSLKIDVAAYDTEAESLKTRVAGLRDERETLRNEMKTESTKAREMEARLAREETRIRQFETRLAREMAANADKDSFLERRATEIERLKSKIKDTGIDLRDASKALRAAGLLPAPARKENKEKKQAAIHLPDMSQTTLASADPVPQHMPIDAISPTEPFDIAVQADDVRHRAAALSERLIHSKAADDDDAIRDEITGIAATMVALTAAKEGPASPIPSLLAQDPSQSGSPSANLASRARDMLPPEDEMLPTER